MPSDPRDGVTPVERDATAGITDAELELMRSFVDVPLAVEQWNDQASHDAIKHFAWGIGDDNPLWLDDDYAAATRWGGRVAPPTFVFSVSEGSVARGLSDEIQPLGAGARISFARPIRLGEWVTVETRLAQVEEVVGRSAGRMARQTGCAVYRIDGAEVARVEQSVMCIRKPGANGSGAYAPRPQHQYTAEQLDDITTAALREERRGAKARFWEDVCEEEPLPQVVKGPLDLMDMIAWYAGAIGPASNRGVETRARMRDRIRSSVPGAPSNLDPEHLLGTRLGGAGHQDADAARKAGLPGAYDVAPQRISWVAHCVTNWMGDAGELLELTVQLRRPNVFGDTQWIAGSVARKYRDELWAGPRRAAPGGDQPARRHGPRPRVPSSTVRLAADDGLDAARVRSSRVSWR